MAGGEPRRRRAIARRARNIKISMARGVNQLINARRGSVSL